MKREQPLSFILSVDSCLLFPLHTVEGQDDAFAFSK